LELIQFDVEFGGISACADILLDGNHFVFFWMLGPHEI
jgi:hypothetical protein